jgi:DNA-binding MarR family transcriptional regulator
MARQAMSDGTRRGFASGGEVRKREGNVTSLATLPSPPAIPGESMHALLVMNDSLLCRSAASTLKLNSYHSIAPDATAALRWLDRDPKIGVLVIQGLAQDSSTAEFIIGARRHARRPLGVVLLILDMRVSAILDVARLDGVEIVVAPSTDAELLAASRNAAQWCAAARQAERLRNSTHALLTAVHDQAGALLGQMDQRVTPAEPAASLVTNASQSPLAEAPSRTTRTSEDSTSSTSVSPAMIKALLRLQSLQHASFGDGVIDMAAWIMLLDLLLSRISGKRLGVTALCVGAGVPHTTALRRIDDLVASGLAERNADPADGRRSYVAITDKGEECVRAYVQVLREEILAAEQG